MSALYWKWSETPAFREKPTNFLISGSLWRWKDLEKNESRSLYPSPCTLFNGPGLFEGDSWELQKPRREHTKLRGRTGLSLTMFRLDFCILIDDSKINRIPRVVYCHFYCFCVCGNNSSPGAQRGLPQAPRERGQSVLKGSRLGRACHHAPSTSGPRCQVSDASLHLYSRLFGKLASI